MLVCWVVHFPWIGRKFIGVVGWWSRWGASPVFWKIYHFVCWIVIYWSEDEQNRACHVKSVWMGLNRPIDSTSNLGGHRRMSTDCIQRQEWPRIKNKDYRGSKPSNFAFGSQYNTTIYAVLKKFFLQNAKNLSVCSVSEQCIHTGNKASATKHYIVESTLAMHL